MIGPANPNRCLCAACANPCSGDLTIDGEPACAGCLESRLAIIAADHIGNYRYAAREWFLTHGERAAERAHYAATNYPSDCRGAA